MIKPNVGPFDSAIRILFGAVILSLVWFGPQSALGYLGLIPLASGAAGFCPLYALLHLSSCGSFHRIAKHA